jgi:hypothetical protein
MNINFTDLDLQVLTNFSNINQTIGFKKGNRQRTISTQKNIIAEYQLENKNEIPEDFYFYDLPEFLNFQDMFDKPKIKLLKTEDKILLSDDEQTSEYYCSDADACVLPKKEIKLPDTFIEFELTKNQIKSFKKSSKKLKLPDVVFENKSGKVICKTTDVKNKMSNNVSFVIDKNTNQNFRFHFKVMNLDKILISNYRVRVSSKNICELVSKEIPLTYWIALEENSYFVSVKGDKTNA